ncbi:MAG: glycosyltransferase [Bacillati bacterium]
MHLTPRILDYSIIIPVFNKAALTRQCLETLPATIEAAGQGEVIVIDNASTDETPQVLAQFPWIRSVRNEQNLGYAKANNQGARLATGRFLVLLNNDTQGWPGWLAAMLQAAADPSVGAVGARLLYPDRTVQHAGVVITGLEFGRQSFLPVHYNYGVPEDAPGVNRRREFQVVTGACLLTPADLYRRVGGLDEGFWNGYEDVDYCFKVRERGLRVVYEPAATLFHYESQSGVARFRRIAWNVERLEARWRDRVTLDGEAIMLQHCTVRQRIRASRGSMPPAIVPVPEVTLVIYGDEHETGGRARFEVQARDCSSPISKIFWTDRAHATTFVRQLMELRGHRYLVTVDARARLSPGWLDELIVQVEATPDTVAASGVPELGGEQVVAPLAADARCTLLSLRHLPAHLRLGDFETFDGAVADLLLRALELERGTRAASPVVAQLPPCSEDSVFERVHGMALRQVFASNPPVLEERLRPPRPSGHPLVSIITLSWNAVQFTKIALESIRAHTSEPYEVVVVDNGSGEETRAWLRSIDDSHVRVVYNAANCGYAGGNNIGLGHARGEFVVFLNNDVIVADGWLDGLTDAFVRIPGLGVSAPRSNKVTGHQQTSDHSYEGLEEFGRYAQGRRQRYAQRGYVTDRAIGLCLCVDRRLIGEVGGFDERYGVGNFEDDDFCLRVRAAGYKIYICDDVFIHHFGSQSFAANKVDYGATMRANWAKFAAKWNLPAAYPEHGYDALPAILAGFDRTRHYAAVPAVSTAEPLAAVADDASGSAVEVGRLPAALTFVARATDDASWEKLAAFARRYLSAFSESDPVRLVAIVGEGVSVTDAARRFNRLASRAGVEPGAVPDVVILDSEPQPEADFEGVVTPIDSLVQTSPSSLRRLLAKHRA